MTTERCAKIRYPVKAEATEPTRDTHFLQGFEKRRLEVPATRVFHVVFDSLVHQ